MNEAGKRKRKSDEPHTAAKKVQRVVKSGQMEHTNTISTVYSESCGCMVTMCTCAVPSSINFLDHELR